MLWFARNNVQLLYCLRQETPEGPNSLRGSVTPARVNLHSDVLVASNELIITLWANMSLEALPLITDITTIQMGNVTLSWLVSPKGLEVHRKRLYFVRFYRFIVSLRSNHLLGFTTSVHFHFDFLHSRSLIRAYSQHWILFTWTVCQCQTKNNLRDFTGLTGHLSPSKNVWSPTFPFFTTGVSSYLCMTALSSVGFSFWAAAWSHTFPCTSCSQPHQAGLATQASVVAAVDLTAWMELKPRTSWVPVDQCWGLTFLSSKAQDCARQRSLVPALHLRLLHRKQQPHLFLLS